MMTGARGFTLIEMIVVMVITGIIGGIVAVFIARPVQGYMDSARRAELTDAADTALRRLGRDVRLALPNSVRLMTSGNVVYLEFIMSSSGGRFRTDDDYSNAGTLQPATSFDALGAPPTFGSGDYIVVNNFGNGAQDDAYIGNNRGRVSSIAGNTITLTSNPFTNVGSGINRFQVVPAATQAVSFACPITVAGDFRRYWQYGFNATQSVPAANIGAGSPALLVANATCNIAYAANVQQRMGLLSVTLTLADSSSQEHVSLFYQIHVDNTP